MEQDNCQAGDPEPPAIYHNEMLLAIEFCQSSLYSKPLGVHITIPQLVERLITQPISVAVRIELLITQLVV